MKRTEILSTTKYDSDNPDLFKIQLDQPQAGQTTDVYSFTLSGWVLGHEQPVKTLVISSQGQPIKTAPVDMFRPKVNVLYPASPGNNSCGFNTEIGLVGLPHTCEIEVSADLADGRRVPMALLRVRHEPVETTHTPLVQPLMITSEGRSGSTWSMHLLGEHPEIVIHKSFPYETMAANYWIHLFKVLTDPANHLQSTGRLGFTDRPWNIGHNPYFTRPLINDASLRTWFGADLVARTAGFCQQNIDEYYLRLAASQGEGQPRYFAEKNRGNYIPGLLFDLYPSAREIFVFRDFRDMVCSMFAFNRRRGFVGVGPLNARDDADFIRLLRPVIERLMAAYRERSNLAIAIKYEDLVLSPETVLPRVLDYLGVASDFATIRGMIKRASKPESRSLIRQLATRFVPARIKARRPEIFTQLQSHQTSGGDPAKSVGRWKTDLSPELQGVAHEAFGDLLVEAGYSVDPETF